MIADNIAQMTAVAVSRTNRRFLYTTGWGKHDCANFKLGRDANLTVQLNNHLVYDTEIQDRDAAGDIHLIFEKIVKEFVEMFEIQTGFVVAVCDIPVRDLPGEDQVCFTNNSVPVKVTTKYDPLRLATQIKIEMLFGSFSL